MQWQWAIRQEQTIRVLERRLWVRLRVSMDRVSVPRRLAPMLVTPIRARMLLLWETMQVR